MAYFSFRVETDWLELQPSCRAVRIFSVEGKCGTRLTAPLLLLREHALRSAPDPAGAGRVDWSTWRSCLSAAFSDGKYSRGSWSGAECLE